MQTRADRAHFFAGTLIVFSLFSAPSVVAQTSGGPAICDELPKTFVPAPRKALSPVHQAALKLRTQNVSVRAAKAAELLPPLIAFHAEVIRREGTGSIAGALLRYDIADTIELLDAPDRAVVAQVRHESLAVLVRGGSLEAVEAAVRLDEILNSPKGDAERHAQALRRLQAHRSTARDVVRAAPLWQAAIRTAPSRRAREQLSREQLAAALNAGQTRWVLQARHELLTTLIETKAGQTLRELEDKSTLRTALIRNRSTIPEFLQLARESVPEIKRRLAWPTELNGSHCSWISDDVVDLTAKVIIATGDTAERLPALRMAIAYATAKDPLATDNVGALINMAPVLAARPVDRDLYIQGMAAAAKGQLASEYCSIVMEAPEICSLRSLADSYSLIGLAPHAIPLLRDAIEVAEAKNLKGEVQALLKVEAAELEWRSGTAAEAPNLLAMAENLVRGDSTLERSLANIKALRLRAIIADAQLDDHLALQSFDRLVRIAIELNQRRPREQPAMLGNTGAGIVADTSYQAARELVHRHIRRRFCADCGEVTGGARPAIEWMQALFTSNRNSGFQPTMEDFLLLRALPSEVWSNDMHRKSAERFKESLASQSDNLENGPTPTSSQTVPALAQLQKLLPSTPNEETQLRTLALARLIASAVGGDPDPVGLPAFVNFLQERDVGQKRSLWRAYYRPIADLTFRQFGNDTGLYETLDALARGLQSSGYDLAARVVFESLVDEIARGASTGKVQGSEALDALTANSAVAVPALARIASFAIQRREWVSAHALLDLAGAVIQRRLATEWRSGNDRIAAGLNELRSAIRLTAQLRGALVNDNGALRTFPTSQAKLFADLQMAMFSDTASIAQAVDRRRIAANPTLVAAIRRRDDALAKIASVEKFRFVNERFSLTTVDDTVRALTIERDSASSDVQKLMPVAEDTLTPTPIPLEDAQKLLGDGEALLLLHAASHAVYGQLIARDSGPIAWITKLPIENLEQRIKKVRAGIDVASGSLPQFPFDEAFELYEMLLGPAKAGLVDVRRLVVVADGPLSSLPLAILPTEAVAVPPIAPDEMRDAKIPWLVRKYAVATLTSPSALKGRGVRQLASQATTSFAGIGNPILIGTPGTYRGTEFRRAFLEASRADVEALRRLPALPDTAVEIASLGAILNASDEDLKIGAEATEAAVKRMPLKNYRIITFATHGLVAGAAKGTAEPGLVLTPPESATDEDDGFLGASEVSNLQLDADVVVLSACNTASSDGRPRAEGLSGLARSFLAAGARGIIATHWAIPSRPAVELTTRMVAARRSNASVGWDGALRSAMLALIDEVGPAEFAHPANWGAFTAIGLAGDGRSHTKPR